VKILERIKIVGFRKVRTGPGGQIAVREANGELVVELEEDGGLRAMAHDAIDSQGCKCKSGPLVVRFMGTISVREPRPDESLPPAIRRGYDDVFAGHAWASRPR
jgi:hypothetical protein